MVPLLGLWLLLSLAASQEICSSPGELPAPSLLLDKGCARNRDRVTLMCFIPLDTSLTRVIFCKDGKEILMLPKDKNKFIFELPRLVSPESAGNYSCRYQHKDDSNQEKNSFPSTHQFLSVTDGSSPPNGDGSGEEASAKGWGLTLGFAVIAGLALGLLWCFLMKKVAPDCRTQRDTGANQNSPASEDHIDYAVVTSSHTEQQPSMNRDMAVTYAVVGKGNSSAGHRASPIV